MGAMVVDVADAVVSELAAASNLPQPINPERHYRPAYDLEQLQTLRVSVVPQGLSVETSSRSANQYDVTIDVAIQQRATERSEIDALMHLVEKIADHLRLRRLTLYPQALWQRMENLPVYSPEHLESKQVFTSVLRVTYRVIR